MLLVLLGMLDASGDVPDALRGFLRAVAIGLQPVNQPCGFYCRHALFHALSTSYQVYLPLRAGMGRFRHVPQGLARVWEVRKSLAACGRCCAFNLEFSRLRRSAGPGPFGLGLHRIIAADFCAVNPPKTVPHVPL